MVSFVTFKNMNPSTPSTEMRLQKIQRVSDVLRKICHSLLVPVVALPLIASVGILTGRSTSFNFDGQYFAIGQLGLGARLMLVTAVLVTAAVAFKALGHLRRLFRNYSQREVFTIESARHIRDFGVTCMLWGAVKVVWLFLPLAISSNPPHHLDTSGDAVFIGAAIVGIAWFTEMAAALREENDLTI